MSRIVIDFREPRGRVSCTPSWTISAMEKVKAMPGQKKFVDRVMHFALTQDNINFVRSAFPQAERIGLESDQIRRRLAKGPRRQFSTAYEPTPLQAEAFSAARGKKLFAFFEKPGAGKTKMVLDKAADMWCAGEIDGLFVFSYSTVHEQWILDEAPKHLAKGLPVRAVAWRSGKKLDQSIFDPDPSVFRIFSMNYEAYATSDKAFAAAKKFAYSGAIMAAADESQRLKTHDSAIGQRAVDNREDWEARVIASGEPTPLGVQDYYNQFCFLDPNIIGAWTYSGFRAMYCRMGGFNNTQIVGYQNQENLHRLMSPYVHVGAPDIKAKQIFEVSKFDLSPPARRAYNQLLNELRVDIDGQRVLSVRSVLPRLVRLQEIACGRMTTNEGNVIEFDNPRMDLLMSLLDIYSSQKVIVWSRFKADHALQAQALGVKSAVFNGDTPDRERREIIESFLRKDDGIQWLLASTGAAGTGLNLQGSCFLNIYYSNNHNAGQRWQSERRTYRLGTEKDVLYIDVAARNTMDVGVINSNRRKREISDMSIAEFRSILDEQEIMDYDGS